MNKTQTKKMTRESRHRRIRSRVVGTESKPRLAVFRSNMFVYAQIIDDTNGKTIVALDSRKVKADKPIMRAELVGQEIAKLAISVGIKEVVFDRGGFRYHGAIKALADGARSGGLKF